MVTISNDGFEIIAEILFWAHNRQPECFSGHKKGVLTLSVGFINPKSQIITKENVNKRKASCRHEDSFLLFSGHEHYIRPS